MLNLYSRSEDGAERLLTRRQPIAGADLGAQHVGVAAGLIAPAFEVVSRALSKQPQQQFGERAGRRIGNNPLQYGLSDVSEEVFRSAQSERKSDAGHGTRYPYGPGCWL